MKLLNVDTVEAARGKLAACTRDWTLPVEKIPVNSAAGRVLAEDIIAAENIPGFRRSTVDGYAVVSADTAAAGESIPAFLKLAGSVEMGTVPGFSINSGECAYVPTGGMLPGGADAVVMVEYSGCTAANAGKKTIAIYEPAAVGRGVAEADEDIRRGETALQRGAVMRPQEIGVLAALGIEQVPVYAPLRLAIFSTGNELAAPGAPPALGEIRDINAPALRALAERRGFVVTVQRTIPDDAALLEQALRGALDAADVVAVSGGSSQGEKDATAEIFSCIAGPGIFTRGLAMKPGKPAILAYNRATKTILAGLPGHPVPAILVFETLLSPLVRSLSGQCEPFPVPAVISQNLAAAPGRACYQPVTLRFENGGYIAEPVFGKSGMISTLARASGYIVIDLNTEGLRQGEAVLVHLF
ncbi:MAG: molybdopterin molybdotransferase MoeA [Treponema sp.]|jgi:molybdopterin molybdotransferase|nr:molybdopterin molybdotransferase MoeA [Treponema sp.]